MKKSRSFKNVKSGDLIFIYHASETFIVMVKEFSVNKGFMSCYWDIDNKGTITMDGVWSDNVNVVRIIKCKN